MVYQESNEQMIDKPTQIDKNDTHDLARELGHILQEKSLTITTAESCTGGLVAGAITDIAGSSAWFERSVVTYSNEAKHNLLEVPHSIFEEHGAVSENCVLAMAKGAVKKADADVAVSVSGIAGPGGQTADKPVGTVWIGWALPAAKMQEAQRFQFSGDRCEIRQQAVFEALRGTISRVNKAGRNKE